jgi:hypothetical protein
MRAKCLVIEREIVAVGLQVNPCEFLEKVIISAWADWYCSLTLLPHSHDPPATDPRSARSECYHLSL